MSEQNTRTIEKRIEFDVPVEQVWHAITDPGALGGWFGHEAVFEPVPGFEGAMIWREHGSFALRVDEVAAPHRLVWSWLHEPDVPFDQASATRVEWILSSRPDGGTVLVLRESGFRTDLHHRQNTEGWNEELGELVSMLAG